MRTFGFSFPRLSSAEERFRKNIAEAAARGLTAAVEIAADGEAAAIVSAIGAAGVGVATDEIPAAAEGTEIAVGVADPRKNS
jgi:hypothetical protein